MISAAIGYNDDAKDASRGAPQAALASQTWRAAWRRAAFPASDAGARRSLRDGGGRFDAHTVVCLRRAGDAGDIAADELSEGSVRRTFVAVEADERVAAGRPARV